MYNWKQNLQAILLMFSSVIVDGFIASYWATSLDTSFGLMVPRTIFLVFIVLSFHYNQNFMLGSAAIFGFLMDTYYLGFFGTHMASLVMVVYITSNLKRVLLPNVLSYTMLSILSITLVENSIYGIMRILEVTSVSYQTFLVSRLGATLVFNGVVMLVFSYFIHRLVRDVMSEN